ncbi:hypothetical protein [Bradyrhizobium barranii]|uniref:Transcription regulator HTH AraC- type ligand binding domain-containing protein n=1 Tax=Bradyrhizobium barranii subsp. barranii TaxID=2823807 RepID=A0A7Z0QGK4_9BRAD
MQEQFDLSRTSLHVLDCNCSDCAVRIDKQIQQFLLLQLSLRGEAELSQDGMMDRISPGQFKIIHGDSPLRGCLLPGYWSMVLLVLRAALSAALAKLDNNSKSRSSLRPHVLEKAGAEPHWHLCARHYAPISTSLVRRLCADLSRGAWKT